jgi:hypothetical protein
MQFDCRAPQFVTQIDRNDQSGFFLQFAMQFVCSVLQRMGTAKTVVDGRRQSKVAAMRASRSTPCLRESAVVMSPVYEGRCRLAIPLLAPFVCD